MQWKSQIIQPNERGKEPSTSALDTPNSGQNMSRHTIIKRIKTKFNLPWLRVSIYVLVHHRFTNLKEIFQEDLSRKLNVSITSQDFEPLPCNCRTCINGTCGYSIICRNVGWWIFLELRWQEVKPDEIYLVPFLLEQDCAWFSLDIQAFWILHFEWTLHALDCIALEQDMHLLWAWNPQPSMAWFNSDVISFCLLVSMW